jgi:hypothetical protein
MVASHSLNPTSSGDVAIEDRAHVALGPMITHAAPPTARLLASRLLCLALGTSPTPGDQVLGVCRNSSRPQRLLQGGLPVKCCCVWILAWLLLVSPVAASTWKCAGEEPPWQLVWQGDAIELKEARQTLRFRAVEALRPDPEGQQQLVWVYQTHALGSRSVPLTLIVEHSGRYAECWYARAGAGARSHLVGIVITLGRVLVGCCERQDER